MLALSCIGDTAKRIPSSTLPDRRDGATHAFAPLVILADDDADFRATLVSVLTRAGMRVREVEDGNALVRLLGSPAQDDGAPDLVITDNHMPGCSGLTALAIMQESGMQTPVIVMTGVRDSVTEERAQRYGAVAVLKKPFTARELTAIIAATLPT